MNKTAFGRRTLLKAVDSESGAVRQERQNKNQVREAYMEAISFGMKR